jgi:hypothetical protein
MRCRRGQVWADRAVHHAIGIGFLREPVSSACNFLANRFDRQRAERF